MNADDVVTGAAWDRLADAVAGLRSLVYLRDPPPGSDPDHDRAEGLRYLLRFLAAGINVCVEHDDTEVPELARMMEDRMSWGLDNPDCLYTWARVDPAGTYRLTGRLGTNCHTELQVTTGHYADGRFTEWSCVDAVTGGELTVDQDRRFALTLAPEPPAGGDHLATAPGGSFLLIRQYFDDWAGEEPAELAIERIDGPLPAPPLAADVLAARLGLLVEWLTVGATCWADLGQGLAADPVAELQPFVPPASASGLKGQAYGMGGFACAADEALLLELTPPARPPARMWGVSLCDRFWQSVDFADRQSSLSSAQATLTDDGRFVGVISHDDPGVANWLDPGGHTGGTLALRYLYAGDPPADLPALTITRVPRGELEARLPADAPRCSPAERREVLRRRRLAVARRIRR